VFEDFQSLENCENHPLSKDTCGRRSRNPGASAPEGFPRANKDLRGVMESGVDPSHWCWEDHVAEIHGLWRKNPLEEIQGGKHPKRREQSNPSHPLR
jgi:hypothetical protein